MRASLSVALLLLALAPARARADEPPPAPGAPGPAPAGPTPADPAAEAEKASLERAALYSRQHGGLAFLAQRGGRVLYEDYAAGRTAESPHRLASGTKSFWGVLAVAAEEDGLLTLDEKVGDTLTEWKDDPVRSRITIRQLLTLTSGLELGTRPLQDPRTPDKYAVAVALKAVAEPGSTFRYGPGGYYVFGELLRRKLLPRKEDPLDYLKRRILDPIGLKPYGWTSDLAEHCDLPHGASLTAREWAKFGELLRQKGSWDGKPVVKPESLAKCFVGSAANPGYGLTFWLPTQPGLDPLGRPRKPFADLPPDVVNAAGLGGQSLLVSPSLDLVVVVQAERDRSFDASVFWSLLRGRTTTLPPLSRPTPEPPAELGAERIKRFIAALDKDGDGLLGLDEVGPLLAARFEDIDENLDGLLSPEELKKAGESVGPARPAR